MSAIKGGELLGFVGEGGDGIKPDRPRPPSVRVCFGFAVFCIVSFVVCVRRGGGSLFTQRLHF